MTPDRMRMKRVMSREMQSLPQVPNVSVTRAFWEVVSMQYLNIQKTSLGQAMVRLTYAHARDTLI
jgi:hypothetical protein